jgi:hypothetical protein
MKGHVDGQVPELRFGAAAASWCDARVQRPAAVERSLDAGRRVGTLALHGSSALVRAVRRLVDRAVDEILLGEQRVTSAAEARRLLAGEEKSEALAGDVQRVVALAVPVARRLARGARVFKMPWVMLASTSVSVGFAVRTGVREIQALSSLLAYRLEQSTGAPSDPELVKKLAVDLYLNPKRTPQLDDDKLRFVRLTRKWLLSGAFGRKTEKRSTRALAAAERIDTAAAASQWEALKRRNDRSLTQAS